MTEPEVIKPRQVTIGGSSQSTPGFQLKYVWALSALCVAALLLLALILLAPQAPEQVSPPPIQAQEAAATRPRAPDVPTPLQMERQKRALEEVNAFVKRFTELEIELEDDWNVQAWGEQAFREAQELATQAESAFAEEAYQAAFDGYAQGVSALEALLSLAEGQYEQQVSQAISALDQRDAETATQALQEAARYQPGSAVIEAGRRRLEKLDEVIALFEQALEAGSEARFDDAITLMQDARTIDPNTQGAAEFLRRMRQSSLDARFRKILAEGYGALDQQDFNSAEEAFRQALGLKPDDPGATQGLEQAVTGETNRNIQSGLAEAAEYTRVEDWEQAILAFHQVRQIDPSLSEANEGMAYVRMRKELDDALRAMIASPGQLADDRQFAKAKDLLERSNQISSAGPRLDEQRQTLARQINIASQSAQVLLLSDSETDVRLQYHGDLGRFKQRTLALRPGRYLVQGGRDGYRELRFEIDVVPGEQRVEVICSEPI